MDFFFFFFTQFFSYYASTTEESYVIVQFGPKFLETAIIFLLLMPFFYQKRQVQPLLNAHRLIIKI